MSSSVKVKERLVAKQVTQTPTLLSPTMAHFKLVLGPHYTGNPKADLKKFLADYFHPVDNVTKKVIASAGADMLKDTQFIDQMVEVLEKEIEFSAQHERYMVLIHTADSNALFLYHFISLWRKALQGKFKDKLDTIKDMRFFDFMMSSYEDIKIFLQKIHKRKDDKSVFNNTSGFSERAIACSPSLIASLHYTASCSLWWHYQAIDNERLPLKQIITEFLTIVGIYSEARLNRYLQLLDFEKNANNQGRNQSLLQQIFVPYELADKRGYVCQLWGEELGENRLNLALPSTLLDFRKDPVKFEASLRADEIAFNNKIRLEYFNKPEFHLVNELSVRFLYTRDERVKVNSYFRNGRESHNLLTEKLAMLIKEDYADYIVSEVSLGDGIVEQAVESKNAIRTKIGFFEVNKFNCNEVIYLQQRELYEGLVQNPDKKNYGNVIHLSKEQKQAIQDRLGDLRYTNKGQVYLYSVCRYLKGYSYYDLLKIAADQVLLHRNFETEVDKEVSLEEHQFLYQCIDDYVTPDSIEKVPMSPNGLYELRSITKKIYQMFDPTELQFRFYQPELYHFDKYCKHELETATECFLRHARLAKDKASGHGIEHRKAYLY